MDFRSTLRTRFKQIGKVEKWFLSTLILECILWALFPASGPVAFLGFTLVLLGLWVGLRLIRLAIRKSIWRLRNRLLVTYLFIALVPILLIVALVGLGAFILASQISVYLARSELDRTVSAMQGITETLSRTEPSMRKDVMRRVSDIYRGHYPGIALWMEDPHAVVRWPEAAEGDPPPKQWETTSGVAVKDGRYYAWSHLVQEGVAFTAATLLTRKFLSEMVPGLGEVYFLELAAQSRRADEPRTGVRIETGKSSRRRASLSVGSQDFEVAPSAHERGPALPPPANRFDREVQWFSLAPVSLWTEAGKTRFALMVVHTRFSAILQIISSQRVDQLGGILPIILLVIAILVLIVEIISIVIGASLTRTITAAVHELYVATQRVMQSDFTHRIKVSGNDQLAALSTSFNSMTANLERLVAVAKEKERMQAEIEIARQVQEQLYPKTAPAVRTLRVTALCQPARMVSGDYYDFQRLVNGNHLAVAIGDVAGKGISAALLMASIQSAMRMELRTSIEPANGSGLSTAHMVSDLNQQLYQTTSPEKYATFFFSLYDEISGVLNYTNAGHLPPLLFRKSEVSRLEVNGTVVGAFPKSLYEESSLQLESGDLLVCYTDGVTEPENEYGEMFGEERLIDMVAKNVEREETLIIELVMDAVRQWTGSPELQDDMTILLARKQ